MRDENDDDGMVFQQITMLLAEKGLISDRWPKTIILKRGRKCLTYSFSNNHGSGKCLYLKGNYYILETHFFSR